MERHERHATCLAKTLLTGRVCSSFQKCAWAYFGKAIPHGRIGMNSVNSATCGHPFRPFTYIRHADVEEVARSSGRGPEHRDSVSCQLLQTQPNHFRDKSFQLFAHTWSEFLTRYGSRSSRHLFKRSVQVHAPSFKTDQGETIWHLLKLSREMMPQLQAKIIAPKPKPHRVLRQIKKPISNCRYLNAARPCSCIMSSPMLTILPWPKRLEIYMTGWAVLTIVNYI